MEKFSNVVKEIIKKEPFKDQNLKFLGIGAEKMVFEIPGSKEKIIKINKDFLKGKIYHLLKNEFDNSGENQKLDKMQKDLIAERKIIERDISDVFGSEHVLRNGVFKVKIPITKDIIIKLLEFEGEHTKSIINPLLQAIDDNRVYEIKTIAETQTIAEELKYKEEFKTKDLSTNLITHDNFRSAKDIPKALSLVRELVGSYFLSEFDENSKDKKYVEIVKEIIEKIIEYTKKTGLIIDIFGQNNITIFTKEDGSLDYHLLDVITPFPQDINIKNDKDFDGLRHAYTYYYSIKSLADKLGIDNNLEPQDLNYFKGGDIPTEGEFSPKKI